MNHTIIILLILLFSPSAFAENDNAEITDMPWLQKEAVIVENLISTIIFNGSDTTISLKNEGELGKILDFLNKDTNNRIQINAYAARYKDSANISRQLSLKRAIAIRKYLTSKNIDTQRIIVSAKGSDTDGIKDRADIIEL